MSKPIKSSQVPVPEPVLAELLTPSEVRMIKNRWRIISLIEAGLPVRKVAAIAKVGTDTVVRMSKKRRTSSKIKQFLNRHEMPKSVSNSKWTFGQTQD